MGDVINLRQARKQRDRASASRLAETNRAKFGRTKAERLALQAEAARQEKQIEGARRDNSGGREETPTEDR
ncbi:DUF4169 family protein [Sphingobium aromaticiconvertens]|uniref:DUF4169 family protein n=1 Tax=Sphingobium aromaticiconvertens TaxID=365341 RepID=UPI0030198D87